MARVKTSLRRPCYLSKKKKKTKKKKREKKEKTVSKKDRDNKFIMWKCMQVAGVL